MIFGTWNPEKIWHRQLVHLSTLPAYCNHFTLGNPKKSIFQQLFHTYFRLFVLSQKKTNYNCCTAICLLTVVYVLPIICVAIFYGQFFLFGQSFIEPPMPTHKRLFSKSPTFGGMQHYLQSDVKCKSFTFYRWHFSGVVGKGVRVCFLLR